MPRVPGIPVPQPQDRYSCVFTYASQGGTNERWQMSLGTSEDHQHFTCTIWRPQGKSYLYFTQFRAEVRGAEVEYGMAYSKAAFEKESDVPLQSEEFEVTKTAEMTMALPTSLSRGSCCLDLPTFLQSLTRKTLGARGLSTGTAPLPSPGPRESVGRRGPSQASPLPQCPTGPAPSSPSSPSW
ncbi:myeloid-derived growth factor isoform X2 [Equus caballus]|uniref:myeloid-derived growth factor isoform X2 n=1 Tax=Equus caballus TaxID=9796 RepID=UPI0038B355F8